MTVVQKMYGSFLLGTYTFAKGVRPQLRLPVSLIVKCPVPQMKLFRKKGLKSTEQ